MLTNARGGFQRFTIGLLIAGGICLAGGSRPRHAAGRQRAPRLGGAAESGAWDRGTPPATYDLRTLGRVTSVIDGAGVQRSVGRRSRRSRPAGLRGSSKERLQRRPTGADKQRVRTWKA